MKRVKGEVFFPGDKSISHRAALFAALSNKQSYFTNFNFNQDCTASLNCVQAMGIEWVSDQQSRVRIIGKKLSEWEAPQKELNAENSGTTARLLSGILCNASFSSILIGDESLSQRPMKRIIDPLIQMGAKIESNEYKLPMVFKKSDELHGISYKLPMASAQVKSAVLLSGLFANGQTEVIESKISRDHTERMLGLNRKENQDGTWSITSSPNVEIPDLSMTIPGDFSSAAFFIIAALALSGSELVIKDVSLNPTRTGLLEILNQMGATIEIEEKSLFPEPCGDIFIRSRTLRNIEIPLKIVPNIIDEIPILAILATQSSGEFVLHGAEELRYKESDRITSIISNLRTTGIEIEEHNDGFTIVGPQQFKGGQVITNGDHRIAMCFGIANLFTDENIGLDNPNCASVSFPEFWNILDRIVKD